MSPPGDSVRQSVHQVRSARRTSSSSGSTRRPAGKFRHSGLDRLSSAKAKPPTRSGPAAATARSPPTRSSLKSARACLSASAKRSGPATSMVRTAPRATMEWDFEGCSQKKRSEPSKPSKTARRSTPASGTSSARRRAAICSRPELSARRCPSSRPARRRFSVSGMQSPPGGAERRRGIEDTDGFHFMAGYRRTPVKIWAAPRSSPFRLSCSKPAFSSAANS